jgi:hypothetical protein
MEDIGKVIEEIYINFIRRSLKDINEASRRHKTALANVKNFEQLSTTMKRLYAVQTTEIGFHSIPPVVIWRDLGYSIPIYFRELAMNIAERLGLEYSEDLYESETDKFFFSVIHAPSVSPDLFSPLSFSPNTPISLIPIPFKGFAGIVFIQSLNETPEEVRNIFYGLIQHRTLAYRLSLHFHFTHFLCSIMIEQGLSPQPPFRWVMGLLRAQRHLAHIPALPPFWAEPTSAWEVIPNQ